ncbi:conserved hypothetical protein [Mucor ambiguus]|uniref:RGS domain-containing protein n=1 Tax=Mucor ambiguus TaxID=91626 RepID=A0A0C9LV56_9FUNG|nr:conserved hypothetical protein [Mucor ambiguus]
MFGYVKTFPRSLRRWFKSEKGDLKEVHIQQVLSGQTQQPISLEDFRLFLLNKEHTIQNLEFHAWLMDYRRKFEALPEHEKAKSPPPKESASEASIHLPLDDLLIKSDEETKDPTVFSPINDVLYKTTPGQPLRAELDSALQTFFYPNSFKELNIEPWRSRYVLYNACYTTHPDVFVNAHEYIYGYLNERSLRHFMHHALQNVRYSAVMFFYMISFFLAFQSPLLLYTTYSLHAPRVFRWPIILISFLSALLFASGRSGLCPTRALLGNRMVPHFELAEYKKFKQGQISKNKFLRRSRQVEVEDQVERKNWKRVVDPRVKKYHYEVVTHIMMFTFLFCGLCTALAIGISNEYDPETLAKMMEAMKAAGNNSTTAA